MFKSSGKIPESAIPHLRFWPAPYNTISCLTYLKRGISAEQHEPQQNDRI
jgi:hypothetical protein